MRLEVVRLVKVQTVCSMGIKWQDICMLCEKKKKPDNKLRVSFFSNYDALTARPTAIFEGG